MAISAVNYRIEMRHLPRELKKNVLVLGEGEKGTEGRDASPKLFSYRVPNMRPEGGYRHLE